MGTHDKASVWIVGIAALLSGLVIGYVLPGRDRVPPTASETEPPHETVVVTPEAPKPDSSGNILDYDLTGVAAEVKLESVPVETLFTVERLRQDAAECDRSFPDGHFTDVMKAFEGMEARVLVFTHAPPAQGGQYRLTVIPNAPGYADLTAFAKDFGNICYAGAEHSPRLMNADWLVFANVCGTGYDDGSGNPHGCEEVRRVVEPTLRLQPR